MLKIKRIIFNSNILAFLIAVLSGMASVKYLDLKTSNVFALLFLFAYYIFYKNTFSEIKNTNKKTIIVSSVVGCIFSLFMTLGKSVYIVESFGALLVLFYTFLYFFGFFFIFSGICLMLYSRFQNKLLAVENKGEPVFKKKALVFIICLAVILCAWIPYFLRDYPGNITPDSNYQMQQVLGQKELTNHHPIAHTMFVKLIFNIGMKLFNGSQTQAVAFYSIVQAVLLAMCFSYLCETLYKFRYKKIAIILITAFFALMPYHAIYSMTMWKDVLFGGIVLVLSITIWRIVRCLSEGKKNVPAFELIMLFVFGVGMCLFRSNGLYAFILLVGLMTVFYFKKSILVVGVSVLALVCSFVIKGPVYNTLGAEQPDTIESLSVPAQHISRAIVRGATLTDEEYELLSKVVDVDKIAETYSPTISDPIKALVRETDNQQYIDENKLEFLKLWISVGLRNPTSYILAQIDQTIGYWYPDVQYWVYATYIQPDGLECYKNSMVSAEFSEFMTNNVESYLTVPYLGLFWSIGMFTWVVILMLGFVLLMKRKEYLLIYLPVIALILTLMIATPVHAEFRYAYCLFTTVPLLAVIPFERNTRS